MLSLAGNLDTLHLNDLLEWLHMTRAKGRLFLTAGTVTRAFDFAGGKVVFAASSRAAERLASWLLRKNFASRSVLLRCLATSQIQGEPFTTVLLRETAVTPEELKAAASALAVALVSRILREDRVFFRFDPHYPVRLNEGVKLELAATQLVMEAAVHADSRPPTDHGQELPPPTLEPASIEAMFWDVLGDLAGTSLEAAEICEAHQRLLQVGELLGKWVTQGPPLLPLFPREAERVAQAVSKRAVPNLEDAPTLAWDFLALVNGLDSPGISRATSFQEAWIMAGDDAFLLANMLLENSRWRRERSSTLEEAFFRLAVGRAAAARALVPSFGLGEETAATAAVLPVVLLAVILTAFTSMNIANPGLQRAAARRLLRLLGRAAGTACGLPEVLLAGLSGEPPQHPGAQVAEMAAVAAGESGEEQISQFVNDDPAKAAAFALARQKAQEALAAMSR